MRTSMIYRAVLFVALAAALAHRPLQMGALVVPGDQLAVDLEHADLGAVAGDHLAAAFLEFVETPYHVRFHRPRFLGMIVVVGDESNGAAPPMTGHFGAAGLLDLQVDRRQPRAKFGREKRRTAEGTPKETQCA